MEENWWKVKDISKREKLLWKKEIREEVNKNRERECIYEGYREEINKIWEYEKEERKELD